MDISQNFAGLMSIDTYVTASSRAATSIINLLVSPKNLFFAISQSRLYSL